MKGKKWTWEVAYKKWFWLRFILLLIVLGLSIALAYFTFCRKTETSIDTFVPVDHSIKKLNLGKKTDTDWNIYSNSTYGFHVMYPPGFTVVTKTPLNSEVVLDLEIKPSYNNSDHILITMYKDAAQLKKNLDENIICTSQKTILGKEKVPVTLYDCGDAGTQAREYYAKIDDRIGMLFSIVHDESNSTVTAHIPDNVIQTILNSFSFTI